MNCRCGIWCPVDPASRHLPLAPPPSPRPAPNRGSSLCCLPPPTLSASGTLCLSFLLCQHRATLRTPTPRPSPAAAVACRGADARPPRHSGSPAPPSGASPTRRPCPPVGRPAFAGPWSPAQCSLPCVCSPGLGPQCHPRIRRVSRGRGVASTLRFET